LDCGWRRQYLRLTSHPQHGHRQVGPVGSGEQAGGPHSLARQQADPAVRRCQQNHPAAGAPLLASHHGGLQFRVYDHLLDLRLPAAVARGGDRSWVVAQVHHQGRRRPALRG
jgi:hypothetical protein